MTKESKNTIQMMAASAVLICAHILMFCAFWVDPVGEIHESNLIIYGEAMSFVGAVMGLDSYYRSKYNAVIKRTEQNKTE